MQFGNHTSDKAPRDGAKGWLKNRLSAAVAAAALAVTGFAVTSHAADTPHFDWSIPTDTDPNYTPSPFLSDTNFAQVASFLTTYHAAHPTSPLAVKVISPLTSAGAKAIFNTFPIQFVFADFEDTSAISKTAALTTIVRSSTSSNTAFVGNFNTYNVSNVAGSTLADPTRPNGTPANGAKSFQNILVNKAPFSPFTMVNPAAYPGAPDYRTASQSWAPNIRSALFVLPVDRVTFATLALTPHSGGATTPPSISGGVNIPWVSRFNNWGNSLLDTDHNSANGYQFVQNAGNPSNGQLLSRGDFSAQVLTYRLRGAYSYNLFNYYNPNAPSNQSPYSSVVGYTPAQERTDAFNGWNANLNSTLAGIFGNGTPTTPKYNFVNLINRVPVGTKNGATQYVWSEASGMMYSGVYDTSAESNGKRDLVVMLSNMAGNTQHADLVDKIGGFAVDLNPKTTKLDQDEQLKAGTHHLLEFQLKNNIWELLADNGVFTDDNRNGIGVPEPTSLGVIALGAVGLLARRRRK